MQEKDTSNNLKSVSILKYSCPDIDVPIEGNTPEYHCCQYCLHISDEEVNKKAPDDWVCDLPNREAQRRHFANLDNKQQILLNDLSFLCEHTIKKQLAEDKRQSEWKSIVQYEKNFKKREG
jgi:hypothetical protein